MSNVIEFRPRSEVLPASVPVVRTEAQARRLDEPQPLTVEAGVPFVKLFRALHAGGFVLTYDQRTGCFLVREATP